MVIPTTNEKMLHPLFTPLGSVLLSLSLSLTGVNVTEDKQACSTNTNLMGEYVLVSKEITLCSDNIEAKGDVPLNILKHEAIHAIHHNLGWEERTFLHEVLITFLVRNLMHDDETMAVLINYQGSTDQEFEARFLSLLPAEYIALAVLLSSI